MLAAATNLVVPSGSSVDMAFRRILVLSKLFTKSWGHPMTLKQLAKHKKDVMSKRLVNQYIDSIKMDMIIEKEHTVKGMHIIDGRFRSPYAILFPEQMPGPLQWAHWRGYLPMKRRGVCIHLAGTGDHSYFRREYGLVNALCQEGIGAILLQNPFYTDRKPPQQFRSSLENVTDLFVMGAALISECNYLIKWAFKEGYGPVALSGISMGGHMASLAASNSTEAIGVIPCLSWTTAGPVYTEGAIAPAINYSQLQKQIEDEHYLTKLRNIPDVTWIDEMFVRNAENNSGLAYNLMRILMDEFTLLSNYPVPLDTSLCSAVIAEDDAYVIRTHGAPHFQDVWPGMNVVVMPNVGHVQAYFVGHHLFRKTISTILNRIKDQM